MITHEINSGTPWIVQFAGQSSPWRRELGELTSGGGQIRDQLEQVDAQAEELLAPVLPELTVISAGRLGLVDAANSPVGTDGSSPNGTTNAGGAFASVPGILLAQYGAWLDVQRIVTAAPYAVIGHSQGVLAAAMIASDSPASVLALARLIGAAATKVTRAAGAERTENSAMLSVRGVPRDLLADLAAQMGADLAIINSYNSMVVSGRPADLERLTGKLDAVAQDSAAIRAAKKTGGAPISPVAEFLDVDAPFHSHLLEPAVALVDTWAERCGISVDNADSLARAVLTDPLDWAGEVAETVKDFGHGYLIDLGPGNLQRLTT